jgi:putative membrane protein
MAQDISTTSTTVENDDIRFIKKAAMLDMKVVKAGKMAQEKAASPQVRSFGELMVREHTNSSAELKTIAGRKNITLPMEYSPMSNAGSSSSTYMGTTGQSYYSGTISERSLRGTKGMRLSKAQTTPSKRYYNGTPTYWTDKDVNTAVGTSITTQEMGTGTTYDVTLIDMENDHKDKLNRLSQKSGAEFDHDYMDMVEDDHERAVDIYEDAAKSSDIDVSNFATKMLPLLRQHREQAKTIKSTTNSIL